MSEVTRVRDQPGPLEAPPRPGAWSRAADRSAQRPPDIAYALPDRPPPLQAAGLAAQMVAIQSIYLVLPGVVGAAFGLAPLAIVDFLCLSVAAVALAGFLQALPRGPVGSGYAVPSIPSPVFVAVYLLAAAEGASLAAASGLALMAGLAGAALSAGLRRLQGILPTEVAGVVVFLIGVSLLPRAFEAALPPEAGPELRRLHLAVALGALALMVAVALSRSGLARFGVLIGAAAGTVAALALGLGPQDAGPLLEAAPWFALPRPSLPEVSFGQLGLLPAFLVALLASFASWAGDLVAFQRASDGTWRRPDTPPIRRGFLAQSLGLAMAGGLGGMAPSSSSACVGLAIATRTLARRVAVWSAAALVVLACCPKALALIVLLPDPVKAAMLGHVCCFMMAAGCQLMTSRMLDARRTFVVGLGLAAGLGVLVAPTVLGQELPRALQSAVTAGTAAAVALNWATAFTVRRRDAFEVVPGPRTGQEMVDRVEALGGAWGARRATMEQVAHALLEVAEVLAARGLPRFRVQAGYDEDLVTLLIAWEGEALPRPSPRPDIADLEGPLAAQEAFALWLATRHALTVEGRGSELRLGFAA